MSRPHHRTAGLIAAAVAGSQFMTPGDAWAAGVAPAAGGVSVVGTVASVRTADASLVVTRAYRFRDSRPRTVRFTLTPATTVVVNGGSTGPGGLGRVKAGMQVTVTGTVSGGNNRATRVVAATVRR
ncbi:hypothetical protein [Dactylosporangium sp. NPDC000521]|uniref:hypothetical protein n=1 Tax=Dactylosporangium sp. NPDC000521 TaxID=3363975 RepID=UPI0036772265